MLHVMHRYNTSRVIKKYPPEVLTILAAACCVVLLIVLPALFNVPHVFVNAAFFWISNNELFGDLTTPIVLCLGHCGKFKSMFSLPNGKKTTDLILYTILSPWRLPMGSLSLMRRRRAPKTDECSTLPIRPWQRPRQIGSSASVRSHPEIKMRLF